MKRRITALALTALLVLGLTACGGKKADGTTIKVGATPAPHAAILEVAKEILAEQGYTLDIVEYDDYVTPNTSLEDGSLDANYFQHITYMNEFNAEHGTHMVSVANIHYEPFGLYAGKTAALTDLADGAQIAVPNDGTNEARALLLLEQEGLIKLKEGVGLSATKSDVAENPHDYEIIELAADQLPSRLQDVDMAVINGNYAIDAGLKVSDAVAVEAATGEAAEAYVNVLAVKEGSESSAGIQALVKALQSDTVKTFIEDTYDGAVVPLF
ncbi:MetQ/NlpA family ABC transporter substrate-binding protein [uncultured Oscillibacter sp.]|uniref:MetQ/NlpA family ABC transporter substrate-binding protein n=1 Tax=uncultured Oscillibacter sp. TaxID=876091 RepID=UPI002625FC8C|nr:MetQ/NlpA family ABC transporter substrate-binding protein [uncultured Oscillibacter sp.]